MRFALVTGFVLALALSAFVACGSDETVETDQGKVTVDHDEDTMTIKGGGENQFEMKTGKKVDVPADFPDDIPVYPDSTVVTSMATSEGFMLASESTAELDDVLAFYKEKLGGEGWTTEAEMSMGPQRMISFSKGERQLMVTASRDEGQTQISLTAER